MMLLLATALALEPLPERPAVSAPEAGQCPEIMNLSPGRPPPPGLIGPDGLVQCGGTLFPTSQAADLKKFEIWADERVVPAFNRNTTYHEWEVEQLNARIALLEPKWVEQPHVQRTIGRLETLGVMAVLVGGAYALDRGLSRLD